MLTYRRVINYLENMVIRHDYHTWATWMVFFDVFWDMPYPNHSFEESDDNVLHRNIMWNFMENHITCMHNACCVGMWWGCTIWHHTSWTLELTSMSWFGSSSKASRTSTEQTSRLRGRSMPSGLKMVLPILSKVNLDHKAILYFSI